MDTPRWFLIGLNIFLRFGFSRCRWGTGMVFMQPWVKVNDA